MILVNFKDKQMQSKHSLEEWKNYFNKEGYNNYGNNGSVHDYFYKQSYGKFDLEFDVVGPVTVSKNMASYACDGRCAAWHAPCRASALSAPLSSSS